MTDYGLPDRKCPCLECVEQRGELDELDDCAEDDGDGDEADAGEGDIAYAVEQERILTAMGY